VLLSGRWSPFIRDSSSLEFPNLFFFFSSLFFMEGFRRDRAVRCFGDRGPRPSDALL